jgi:hypothetical protein
MTTEKRTRNANSPLTVGAAYDKCRARLATEEERRAAHVREFIDAEAEWHTNVKMRVPEQDRAQLDEILARASVRDGLPPRTTTVIDVAAEPDARGVMAPLSDERKKIAGMK